MKRNRIELLQILYLRTGLIDSGICVFCGRRRLWTLAGSNQAPSPCENSNCLSHEIEASIGVGWYDQELLGATHAPDGVMGSRCRRVVRENRQDA